jgi:kinesin family protein C2/C3
MSIYEVYNESIVDLLRIKNLDTAIKTNPSTGMFHIPGLTRLKIDSPSEFNRVLSEAGRNRAVSATNCNEQSSRSHLIVSLHVSIKTPNGKQMEANMSLVDLAGSERLEKSGATGSVAKEGMFINKSLSALGDVINARICKSSHVPYRNSVLTSALQECIGGDSKTLLILQVSPSSDTIDETCNSLVFASRVREVESIRLSPTQRKRAP